MTSDFIDTRLQPGVNREASGEPFQQLARKVKTVETVFRVAPPD